MKIKFFKIPSVSWSSDSHHAQVLWSLCVAAAVAFVALQQTMGARHEQNRVISSDSLTPKTLVTGKPLPLSQDELRSNPVLPSLD